jgi:hypothetical protein
MAQTTAVDVTPRDAVVTKCTLSSLTIDTAVDVSHNGPNGAYADMVTFEITTTPTDKSVVNLVRTKASDTLGSGSTSGTTRVTFQAADNAGGTGALTGMVVDVFFHFFGVKAGGIG